MLNSVITFYSAIQEAKGNQFYKLDLEKEMTENEKIIFLLNLRLETLEQILVEKKIVIREELENLFIKIFKESKK